MTAKTTLTRREREREQHKREILDAAEEIFATRGFAEATIEDIAKKADFAVGSIYNFFNGKNDLIHNVLLRLIRLRIAEIEKTVVPKINDPILALRMLTDQWVAHYMRHGAFLRIAMIARMSEGKLDFQGEGDLELRDLMKSYTELISRIFEAGMGAGVVHKIKPEHAYAIFEGICRTFVMMWKFKNDTRPKEALADELFAAAKIALTGK